MTYAELLQHQKDTGMSESDIYQELLAKGYKSEEVYLCYGGEW